MPHVNQSDLTDAKVAVISTAKVKTGVEQLKIKWSNQTNRRLITLESTLASQLGPEDVKTLDSSKAAARCETKDEKIHSQGFMIIRSGYHQK